MNRKGLENRSGQHNCFLNVVIQSLWHLDEFRSLMLKHAPHGPDELHCTYCALRSVFEDYHNSENETVSADHLRRVLAEVFAKERRFQEGQMADATECFVELMESTVGSIDDPLAQQDVREVFEMEVIEQTTCRQCRESSEPISYKQPVQYLYFNNLRSVQQEGGFERVVRRAMKDIRKCPNKRCAAASRVRRHMARLPKVIALGLVWPVPSPDQQSIKDALEMVDLTIDATKLFSSAPNTTTQKYRLQGIILYYGRHYIAVFESTGGWVMFDDESTRDIGSWQDVKNYCASNRFAPSVFYFSRVLGNVVSRSSPNSADFGGSSRVKNSASAPSLHAGSSLPSSSPNHTPVSRGRQAPSHTPPPPPRASYDGLKDNGSFEDIYRYIDRMRNSGFSASSLATPLRPIARPPSSSGGFSARRASESGSPPTPMGLSTSGGASSTPSAPHLTPSSSSLRRSNPSVSPPSAKERNSLEIPLSAPPTPHQHQHHSGSSRRRSSPGPQERESSVLPRQPAPTVRPPPHFLAQFYQQSPEATGRRLLVDPHQPRPELERPRYEQSFTHGYGRPPQAGSPYNFGEMPRQQSQPMPVFQQPQHQQEPADLMQFSPPNRSPHGSTEHPGHFIPSALYDRINED